MKNRKTAVVLFQLGGPDSLDAVEPFLFNLFMDPDIINFPFAHFFRRSLAKFISSRRAPISARNYAAIGGKSPILDLTLDQAKALEALLRKSMDARVLVAMRYWKPLTSTVVEEIKKGTFDEIILLPLYPQYSITTTGSSINEWNRQVQRLGIGGIATRTVQQFYENENYIAAIVERINEALQLFAGASFGDVQLVFSAHGVPVSIIENGDPYQGHIEATVKRVLERGGWTLPHLLCYQSKVGPARWLRPSLIETIDSLGARGCKNVLVIPIAFLTEHIETLHEINIEARHQAHRLGISKFEVMPALNSHPLLIQALADEVLRAREGMG